MKNISEQTYLNNDTAVFQLDLLNKAFAMQLSLPTRTCASPRTDGTHSLRGLPTRLTYLFVAGCHVPGIKDTVLNGLSAAAVQTLPKRKNWRSSNAADVEITPARRLTSKFEMRDW